MPLGKKNHACLKPAHATLTGDTLIEPPPAEDAPTSSPQGENLIDSLRMSISSFFGGEKGVDVRSHEEGKVSL